MTKSNQSPDLPDWYPSWTDELAELYFSKTTSLFVLHGNTHDLVPVRDGRFTSLSEFLANELFGKWDAVLYYDLSTGLQVLRRGADPEKQTGEDDGSSAFFCASKDPSAVLQVLDTTVQNNVARSKPLSLAFVLGHASFVARKGDRSLRASTHVVTFLNWAQNPYVKKCNMAFVLIDNALSDMSERLVGNPHVASVAIPLPTEEERRRYLDHLLADRDVAEVSEYGVPALAKLTAGIGLTDLRVLVQSSLEGGHKLDAERFRDLKKSLLERQAGGMLEFIEPQWDLDMVIGHEAAKSRLREDAELLAQGRLQSVPMGYLFCGPVGTGKSFLAVCAAGTIGIPCVKLKNFRGGLVGETEGNLERVLGVLRSMGPVAVIVDEADAQLGDRNSGGDSGVSGRVFGMIAEQMGDTRYRGKILWMLLTARPDYLPIDLKRQGRAEVHVPLFYPTSAQELQRMFAVLARKLGTKIDEERLPEIPEDKLGQLSGADVEGILGRAWRKSLVAGHEHIEAEALASAIEQFMPMAQSLERELQTLAAIIECTDGEFLPPDIQKKVSELGGRHGVQERLNQLKAAVDAG